MQDERLSDVEACGRLLRWLATPEAVKVLGSLRSATYASGLMSVMKRLAVADHKSKSPHDDNAMEARARRGRRSRRRVTKP